MKRTIALILSLMIILSAFALPAFAAQGDVVDGYCIHCGMPCSITTKDIPSNVRHYVVNCFEYNEPHYHTTMTRYYWYLCPTPDCATNEVLTLIRTLRLDDICHYGE